MKKSGQFCFLLASILCLAGVLVYLVYIAKGAFDDSFNYEAYTKTEIQNGYYAGVYEDYKVGYDIVTYDTMEYDNNPYLKTVVSGAFNHRIDRQYLLVAQKPFHIYSLEEYQQLYTHGHKYTYYWIINTEKHISFGPYIYSEFVDKCNELGIIIF